MAKMPKGLVIGHMENAVTMAIFHMAQAEQHFEVSSLDAYSRQISANLSDSRGLLVHAMRLLKEYAEESVDRTTEHEV